MPYPNVGMCDSCKQRVTATHEIRNGQVYLCKDCPTCGRTEDLISSDAAVWQAKRDLWGYVPGAKPACSMHCANCRQDHHPTIVFIDVTNRCNMNCPICIANIRGMGFDYHPPLEYFERVFQQLAQFNPRPSVELFGGEPTVRNDLIDIVNLGRKHGLRPRVVTNGLRLADEEYCAKLCKTGIRFRIAIDARSPEVYRRLRSNPGVCEKKLKALANLKKYSRRKSSILCCAAKGINDTAMADLIACCHENMDAVNELALLPLAETWEPGSFSGPVATTPEDAERMIQDAVADGGVEFIPAGLASHVARLRSFFREGRYSDRLLFAGVHPNCESLTLLASDGERYRSLDHYFRMPFKRMVEEGLEIAKRLDGKLSRLDPRKPLQRLYGQIIVLKAFLPLVRRAVDLKRMFRGHPVLNFVRMAANFLVGRKKPGFFHKYMNPPRVLRVVILPFEEYKTIDAGRLETCKAAFAYEDVDTGKLITVPACTSTLYRDAFLRKIAAKYGRPSETAKEAAECLPVL